MKKRRFFYSFVIILLLIVVVAGWFATDYLGNKARQEIIGESQSSTLTLSIYVSSTFTNIKGAVKSLAGSPWIAPALLSKGERDIEHANSALDRYNSALSASVSYLMDADGVTVASSNRKDPDSFVGMSYRFRPYFQEAFRGNPDRYFALGITSGKRGFYASHPVQNRLGKVLGVVTMKKDLDEMETFFSKYSFCSLISPEGIIFLSSTPSMVLKSLWPLAKTAQEKLTASQQFGNKPFEAVIEKEIADGADVTLEGKEYFVSRKVIDSDGWSIVLLAPTDRIRLYKLIGILATIFVGFLIMFFSGIIYVTDRSKEALHESEDRFRELFNNMSSGVAVYGAIENGGDFIFKDFNPAAEKIEKVSRKDILGRRVSEAFPGVKSFGVFEIFKRVWQTGEMEYFPQNIYKDERDPGSWRESWVFKLPTGEIVSVYNDVTERKRTEEALAESELFNRSLVENLPDYIIVYGTDGKILYVNPATEKALGYNLKELVGKSVLSYIPEERRDEVISRMKVRQEGRETPAYETAIVAQDGHQRPVIVKGTPIRYHDNPAFLILLVDITESKRAEETLRESEELFRVSMERAPDGVYMNDLEGNFLYGNRKAEEIIGYSREELIGRNYLDLNIAEGSLNKAVELLKGNSEGRSTGPYELELIRKDGRHILIEINTNVVKQRGQTNILGFVRDITERKLAEEEKRSLKERLNRAEKMEALGLLAGGVAHDLNNVLGIVVGYAELVLMKADESSPIRPQLVNIMNGGLKAAAIVDDLLTLARRGVSDRDVLNLNKIIADCQHSPEFANLSSHHPYVKINTDIDQDLLNISGSSVHLSKSLYNLISNASEAMPKGGIVTIKTANQYLDKPIQGYDNIQEGDYVVLSVSDTGEGISADNLKRIFEPFYTKKVMGRSGTGLGLAVVWGTVKDHQGYINVQSEEGKGSTFTLYFPVIKEDITAKAVAVPISEYMGSGESILVVDDVKEQRDLAAGMLRTLNYNVASVSSGEEAVAYMKDHQADLIVLDMIMDPGMDGLDTYKSILEICPKQKAVIVSGFSESDRVRAAKGLGAGAYVRKPYIKEKLGLAVKKEIGRAA